MEDEEKTRREHWIPANMSGDTNDTVHEQSAERGVETQEQPSWNGPEQMMTPPGEKDASPVEASPGERSFSRRIPQDEDMGYAGMKWTKRNGIWAENSTWREEKACTIDPDLSLMHSEKSATKRKMDWTHVNGIWAKSSEQDPDIPVDIPEKDPDIRTNPPGRETELTENVLVKGMMITPPLKRLRKKTTPNPMHIMQNNNITVAYATPLTTTTNRPITTIRHNAQITRDDLLSTSKYYQYHKAMGHTPQHIQHISGRQKKRLLAESGLPTHMHKHVYLIHDKAARTKKQKTTNAPTGTS